jgi:hypothetical protein
MLPLPLSWPASPNTHNKQVKAQKPKRRKTVLVWKIRYILVLVGFATMIAIGLGMILIGELGIRGEGPQFFTLAASLVPAAISMKLVDVRWPGVWEKCIDGKPKH